MLDVKQVVWFQNSITSESLKLKIGGQKLVSFVIEAQNGKTLGSLSGFEFKSAFCALMMFPAVGIAIHL